MTVRQTESRKVRGTLLERDTCKMWVCVCVCVAGSRSIKETWTAVKNQWEGLMGKVDSRQGPTHAHLRWGWAAFWPDMDATDRLQYQTLLPRCPKCGKYGQAYSTVRISIAEMESYFHLLGVCQETDSAALTSMYHPSFPSPCPLV